MAQQKVELRKVRDFSDNLNDTFVFLKENLKPFLTCVIGIAGILMLATAIVSGIYQQDANNIFDEIFSGRSTTSRQLEVFSGVYFIVLGLTYLTATALQVVVTAYFRVYEEKGSMVPTFEEVWNVFKRKFLLVAVYNIPLFVLVFIGLMFCIAPGIYLGVVFAPFVAIVVIEDESFSGAFNRCFSLVKDHFWLSFGIYIVVFLISWFSSGIISLIVGLITGLITYFTTNDLGTSLTIVSSVLNVLGSFFYLILFVSITLHYYSLVERQEGTGIMRKLEMLGTNTATHNPYDRNEEEDY